MNEKEAREIIIKGQSFRLEKDVTMTLGQLLERSISVVQDFAKAEGYLEAIGKAESLARAIKDFKDRNNEQDTLSNCELLIRRLNTEEELYVAFAKWKEEK